MEESIKWGYKEKEGTMSTINFNQSSEDYRRIEQAIRYIEANAARQPELGEIAAQFELERIPFPAPVHALGGHQPEAFPAIPDQGKRQGAAHPIIQLLEATYEAGLSSPGRLHDLFIQTEAVTPGEYKSHGQGIQIAYGFHPTPFGECLLALTERGICFLAFVDKSREAALNELKLTWANASLSEDPSHTAPVVEKIFTQHPEKQAGRQKPEAIPLHLRGTNFQIKVWEALLNLPEGKVTSYESLAEQMGSTRGARAVGNAVAHNPVAYLIPCHRVLKKSGEFGSYRYGPLRKKAILGWEMAQGKMGD